MPCPSLTPLLPLSLCPYAYIHMIYDIVVSDYLAAGPLDDGFDQLLTGVSI
jgi:hypothetical protein